MNEIITRAINSIADILESSTKSIANLEKSQLIDTRKQLHRLLESNLPINDSTQLFCRRLHRLMNYNKSFPNDFWIDLHDDILYIQEELNGKQKIGNSWERFLKKMTLENELEQRKLQFQQTFGERKSLNQLFANHKEFFEDYLLKCISIHSKIQIEGLMENLDDLLVRDFNTENRALRKQKLKCIEIPFDCLNRSLQKHLLPFPMNNKMYETVNNSPSNFLPSTEPLPSRIIRRSETIDDILKSNRWVVILGDPGSAKTTLLRWITRVSAETAYLNFKEILIEENNRLLIRIPILIRISKFAEWLKEHQKETLMDYISQHTWLSQHDYHVDDGSVFKELIDHGHALILLDGLDEIPEVRRRAEIVDLVQRFVDEYVRTPDFISAFDDEMFNMRTLPDWTRAIVETQLPNESDGNQIVITSRIVGYRLRPLVSPFIEHYSLLLMDHKEAKKFVKTWITEVEKGVMEVLTNEKIKLDIESAETLSQRRFKATEAMFENGSELLMSNPYLLSLICVSIFQSPEEFNPKSRVEVYDHAVQSVLRSWTSQKSTISESILTNFLIDLANYLHLQSPSGLIDAFDMEHLCCVTLQKQSLSNDRVKLRKDARELITLIGSNVGIVAEQGLEVFGFLHLSFQEYFVAQSLIRGNIDEVAQRILIFIINPRFRESLLFALGCISRKWPFEEYDIFCKRLFSPIQDYPIPLGTLLFFDAFNDIQRLPSESVIFTALNSLIDHPSIVIAVTYFIVNLSKLTEGIILEWMQSNLKDDKRLFKFCQCLPLKAEEYDGVIKTDLRSTLFMIYQQLYSFDNVSTSGEFVIDQILRKLIESDNAPDGIFENELSSYIASHNICASEIHPLILSVIIAVFGGICLKREETTLKIQFLPEKMHRKSSILASIVEYFGNNKESHAIKIETLINQYENVIQESSPENISLDIIDTFIALICLQGVSQPLSYQKYNGYQALPLALNKLKRIWFYLKKTCEHISSFNNDKNKPKITLKVELMRNVFFSQTDRSDEESLVFSLAFVAALDKLHIEWSSDMFISNIFYTNKMRRYLECQPEFSDPNHESKRNRIPSNIRHLKIFQNEPFFLLTFIPQSLQPLYYYMTIAPINNIDSLPVVVLLSECLLLLESVDKNDPNLYYALLILQSWFKKHMLENYASVMFWEYYSDYKFNMKDHDDFFKEMIDEKLLDQSLIDQSKGWEKLISVERQRISEALYVMQNQEKDLQLFTASISLARLFQSQYRPQIYPQWTNISICPVESQEVYSALTNIFDPILQILALSMISDMRDPLIFDEEQRDKVRLKMLDLLQSLLASLPLLTSTLLFVRCHIVHQFFPVPFQVMTDLIGKKLNEISNDKPTQSQETAFIALRQLDYADLSPYLSEFTKRTRNLSALLHFNSTIFFEYFTKKTTFESLNNTLISIMYLTELAFDVQILKIYTRCQKKNEISYRKQLMQLWNDVTQPVKIMTFKVAIWITNYLRKSDRDEIHQIIEDVSDCWLIERNALSIIEKWFEYRMDQDLRFFAQYAALQLVKEGLYVPNSIDIIKEIFDTDRRFLLKCIVEELFGSSRVDSNAFRQILSTLHKNVVYFSKISLRFYSRKILELILQLELERISSDMHQSGKFFSKSFLSIFVRYPEDLKFYLSEHLQTFVNKQNNFEDAIKDEYLTTVVTSIVDNSIWYKKDENFSVELYNYIFTLLHDQRFPLVQQTILSFINSEVSSINNTKEHIFFHDDVITHLEKISFAYSDYSKNVLAVCLLAYGNCLLKLQEFEMDRNVSNEMQNLLTTFFQKSPSEIISVRAAFCLIFAQQSNVTYRIILSWFENQRNITVKERYNILLQQTLYKLNNYLFNEDDNEFVGHIETYSVELIDTFVSDLYNYMCKKRISRYLSDSEPNYIHLALKFIGENFEIFLSAVQRTDFGKEELKRELCRCFDHTKESTDHVEIVELYAAFGVFTVELVDMLKWIPDYIWKQQTWTYLEHIKQVLDRDVVEKLFQLLDLVISGTDSSCFFYILKILIQFAQNHVVSLLEVYQRVSLVIENVPYQDDYVYWHGGKDIFDLLLNLSSIKKIHSSNSITKLITENDIDKEFEREILDLEKKSILFLRRNYFLSGFRSVSSSSN